MVTVRSIKVEDAVTGEHELGPARAAVVLAFRDGDGVFSATGSFRGSDFLDAARTVGVLAGTMVLGLDGSERDAVSQVLVRELLSGLGDAGCQASICAESALNEIAAGGGGGA